MLYIPVLHIDTNLSNARQKLAAVNQLEKWHADGVILINMAGTARNEAIAGGNAQRSRQADQQIFTITAPEDPGAVRFQAIEGLIFPGGSQDEHQRNDVRIVAEAIHDAAILVTNDGGSNSQPRGILGNRDALAKQFGVRCSDPVGAGGRRVRASEDPRTGRLQSPICARVRRHTA